MPRPKNMKPKVDVADWDKRWEFFERAMAQRLTAYEMYCEWFANEFSTNVTVPGAEGQVDKAEVTTVNMTNRVTRAWTSWVYMDAPGMVAKSEDGFMAEMEGKGSELAKIFTAVGNDIKEKTNLYSEGERIVQDAGMAPFFVAKIGYDAKSSVDEDYLEEERKKAMDENALIKAGHAVEVLKTDYDSAHIDIHRQEEENIVKGVEEMPEDVLENLRAHIEKHDEKREKEGDVPRHEEIRDQRIFIRRKNPRRVAFDLYSPSLRELNWAGEEFLLSATQLVKNKRNTINEDTVPGYNPDKKPEEWVATHSKELVEKWSDELGQYNDGCSRFVCREVIDHEHSQIVCYVVGAKEPFSVREYYFGKYLGGVPYEIEYIIPDPKRIIGVSPLAAWEHQQRDLTLLNTVVAAVAKQSAPGMAYNGQKIEDETEIRALQSKVVGRQVKLKNMESGEKVRDVMDEIPTTKLSSELLLARNEAKAGCEEGSLLGQARLGGGEKTRTATASAVQAESQDRPTKTAATKVDHFFRRLYRKSLRLAKRLYTPATVRRIAGPRALELWPDGGFTMAEIMDDRGIDIVVSSMRRPNTDYEIQQMTNLMSVLLRHPNYAASPSLQLAGTRLMDYLFTLFGAPIDLSDLEKMLKEQPQNFIGTPEESRGPNPEGGGTVNKPDDQMQGMMNLLGGGRTR